MRAVPSREARFLGGVLVAPPLILVIVLGSAFAMEPVAAREFGCAMYTTAHDPCCDGCTQKEPLRWYAGAEAVFVKPHLGVNQAFIEERIGGVPDFQRRAFDFGYQVSPRVWLGINNAQGTGVRASYFRYDDSADPILESNLPGFVLRNLREDVATYFLDAAATGRFLAQTQLQLETFDLEITHVFDWSASTVAVAGGLRYGRLESELFAASLFGSGAIEEGHWVRTKTDGFGPTLAIDGYRTLSGNFALLLGGRGSVLFGDSNFDLLAVDQPPATTVRGFAQTEPDNGMYIGEVSIGVQWGRQFADCEVVIQGVWEGQLWTGMPLATRMGDNFTSDSDVFAEGLAVSIAISR